MGSLRPIHWPGVRGNRIPREDAYAGTYCWPKSRIVWAGSGGPDIGHRADKHPDPQALAAASLPAPQLALMDFAQHDCCYSVHFARYLTALTSRHENPAHRRDRLANFTEQYGHYEADELEKLRHSGIEPD